MDWTHLAHDRGRWQAIVNAVKYTRIRYYMGNYLDIKEELCSMELFHLYSIVYLN